MTSEVATADANKDLITATLQELGMAPTGGDKYGRAKIEGGNLNLDGHIFTGVGEEYTLYARLTDVPVEYQGVWLEPADAVILERPEAAESFCKSYWL